MRSSKLNKVKGKCTIADCKRIEYFGGLCRGHYDQKRHSRGIFRDPSRSRRRKDPNEFIIEGDVCLISLYVTNEKVAEAVIDVEDYDKCKSFRWYCERDHSNNWRVKSTKVGYLSNFIMDFKPTFTMIADHRDGNTLDNRKQNLQIITIQQNQLKKKKQKNNKSGYRGVYWSKQRSKWVSEIAFNGERFRLGFFHSKGEAAFVYNIKAQEFFGEFAVLNQVFQSEQLNTSNRLFTMADNKIQ